MTAVGKGRKVLLRLLFLVYGAVMIWLLFGQRIGGNGVTIDFSARGENYNFIPLETIKLYWNILQNSTNQALLLHAVINLVGNVVLFIPLGWFLPYNWEKYRFVFKPLFLVLLLMVTVEAAQYFTLLGSCDVDDLILNLSGAFIGYCLWKIGTYRQRKK